MNIQEALEAIDRGMFQLQEARTALTETAPDRVVVRAGENLQAALDKGGLVELETGAVFEGTYQLRSNTVMAGLKGAAIRGQTGPALFIPPGTTHVSVTNLELRSRYHSVCEVGVNDTAQTTLEHVPTDIVLTRVIVPEHRSKRAFAIHGSHVSLLYCEVHECWDANGQDSQAVYIVNTPGPVTIHGGVYSSGCNGILLGGDVTRIPGVCPTDVLIDGVRMVRPLSWQTDGINRKIKNSIEVKNGKRVTVRNSVIDGCWVYGQQGEAFVFTPDLDGERRTPTPMSGQVTEVLVEDCVVRNCSTLAGLRGRSYNSYTPEALTVTFRRVLARLSRAKCGGRGQLATITGEPASVIFEDCDVEQDGTSLIYYDPGDVIDPVTKLSRLSGKIGMLAMRGCRSTAPEYGLNLNGYPNVRNWQASVGVLDVRGNAFTGSQSMKTALPENTYAGGR